MKDKNFRKLMLGNTFKEIPPVDEFRIVTLDFPSNGVEKYRSCTYMAGDGFILHLIRMIEKLENRVTTLESNSKKK